MDRSITDINLLSEILCLISSVYFGTHPKTAVFRSTVKVFRGRFLFLLLVIERLSNLISKRSPPKVRRSAGSPPARASQVDTKMTARDNENALLERPLAPVARRIRKAAGACQS